MIADPYALRGTRPGATESPAEQSATSPALAMPRGVAPTGNDEGETTERTIRALGGRGNDEPAIASHECFDVRAVLAFIKSRPRYEHSLRDISLHFTGVAVLPPCRSPRSTITRMAAEARRSIKHFEPRGIWAYRQDGIVRVWWFEKEAGV